MKALLIFFLIFSGCTVGIRIESCPPEDAATVDPVGRYTEIPEGWFNTDRNWWPPSIDPDPQAGESIFDEDD